MLYDVTVNGTLLRIRYTVNTQHRNGNPNKSQWTVYSDAEISCFGRIIEVRQEHDWQNRMPCWGLHFDNERISYLGVSATYAVNPNEPLFIAKFVGDHNGDWHGYPANYTVKNQDAPTPEIIKYWFDNKYISSTMMSKISKKVKCKL